MTDPSRAGGGDPTPRQSLLWAWAAQRKMRELFLVLAGQGIQSAANFLTGAAIGRFTSVSALGKYALGMSIFFVVASLADSLVATPFTYLVISRPSFQAQRAAFGTALLATLGLALLGGLASGAASVFLPELASLLPALPCALVTSLARELIRRRHYVYGEPARALLSDIVTVIIQFAIMIGWLIETHRFDASAAFWAVACACGVAAVLGLLDLRGHIRMRLRLLLPYGDRFVRYGQWLAMGGLCQMLALQSFSWFLFLTSGARITGAFAACVAISNLPNPLLIGLTNYARPALMRVYTVRSWPSLAARTAQLAGLFVAPIIVFALGISVAGGRALTLIYGPDLLWARGALIWTSIALIAVAIAAPLQLAMLAINKPRAVLYLHIGELTAAYLIALPLIVLFGLQGAAIGYFTTMAMGTAVLLSLFITELRRRAA